MSSENTFDLFTINPHRDQFGEASKKKSQSNDEAKRGRIKRDIDDIHEQRDFQRMMDSFDVIGG